MPILEFNGQIVEIFADKPIAMTYQVNDISSVANRNASFSRVIKVPKSATNAKIMSFLSFAGNTSHIPYMTNIVNLYNEAGERLVNNGRALVRDGGDNYEIEIQEGIIDLYKAIENKSLADLDLAELEHAKTVDAVITSWEEDLPYRYILADYNGYIGDIIEGIVNIDYLVPSVNVKYLWDKIFEKYGFTYSGVIFDHINFTNLWMTYPKGVATTGEADVIMLESDHYDYDSPTGNSRWWCAFITATTNILESAAENVHMRPGVAGTYRLEITGTLNGRRFSDTGSTAQDGRLFIGKNGEGLPSSSSLAIFKTIGDSLTAGQEFELTSTPFQLDDNDSICLVATQATSAQGGYFLNNSASVLDVKLIRVDPTFIDFGGSLSDFSIRDFLTEILHRFGLTMHKEKYDRYDEATQTFKSHFEFLTLQEQLQTADIVDWSDKFPRKLKEDYIYGSYAQRNWMRYNYNDKEASHNDFYIEVNNFNLPDSRDVIKSKIYSPERVYNNDFFIRPSHVYKLWDKEIKEGQELPNYKPLDKRYYFMRAQVQNLASPLTIKSYELNLEEDVSNCYMESFYKLSFPEIIQDYYGPLEQILDRSTIMQVDMLLNDIDIANFDFKKLYYIEQLNNYFIVNKINNYISGRLTKVDMVRVLYAPQPEVQTAIKITKVIVTDYAIAVFYELNLAVSLLNFEIYNYASSGLWEGGTFVTTQNPYYFSFTPTGNFPIRLRSGTDISNEVTVTIPSNTTIIVP